MIIYYQEVILKLFKNVDILNSKEKKMLEKLICWDNEMYKTNK